MTNNYEVKQNKGNRTITITNRNQREQLIAVTINTTPIQLGEEQVYKTAIAYNRKSEILDYEGPIVFKVLAGINLDSILSENGKDYVSAFMKAMSEYDKIKDTVEKDRNVYIGHIDENGNVTRKEQCITEAEEQYPEAAIKNMMRNDMLILHQTGINYNNYETLEKYTNAIIEEMSGKPGDNRDELIEQMRQAAKEFGQARENAKVQYNALNGRLEDKGYDLNAILKEK